MKKVFFITIYSLCIVGIIGALYGFHTFEQKVTAQEQKIAASNLNGRSTGVSNENDERSEQFNELIEKSQTNGAVRVIVNLQTDFKAEGELSMTGKRFQRAEIKRVQSDVNSRLKNFRVRDIKQFDFIPYMAFEINAAGLEQLKHSPEVVSIHEDKLYEPTLTESTAVIGAPGGVSNGFSGSGQTVAVLDTGIDKNHVFFSGGKVTSEACYSTTNSTESSTSVCPGGASSSTAADSGLNCPSTTTGCYHGTHVAGIVGGKDTAGNRFGVAKDANIIAIQVFSSFEPSRCGSTATSPCALSYTSDILRGLERVYALSGSISIASVNMSLGGGHYTTNCDSVTELTAIKTAIDNLRSVKIATVIASGNNYSKTGMTAPGCISTAISVGSTTDGTSGGMADSVSAFSNSASFLNLLAPGQTINSSMPGVNNFSSLSGTSMATPHVAGAWAILKQQNPSATVSEILTALTSTGKIITDERDGAGGRKTPRLRVDSALRQLAGTDCARAPMSINQTVNASLDAGDCALETGVNRDLFAFTATAGSSITVIMSSSDFNSYLHLLDPNGKIIASDDDSGGGTNARINLTLPIAGSYTVIATKSPTAFRIDSPQNGNYTLSIGSPTAAPAVVSGRVTLPNEFGLNKALVSLTNSQGIEQTILTGKGGRFRFNDVNVGETYIIRVVSKRYAFPPQIITVTGDITDLDFSIAQ